MNYELAVQKSKAEILLLRKYGKVRIEVIPTKTGRNRAHITKYWLADRLLGEYQLALFKTTEAEVLEVIRQARKTPD